MLNENGLTVALMTKSKKEDFDRMWKYYPTQCYII